MSQESICSYDKYQYKAIPPSDYHHDDLEMPSSSNLNITKNNDYNDNNNNNQLTSKLNDSTSRITVIVILICCALLLLGLSHLVWFHSDSIIVKDDMIVSGELKYILYI